MAYAEPGIASYPSHSIDPREKDYNWILQYCRAAYRDSRGFMPFGQLVTGNLKMAEIKMYSMGKQPVDKYKKMMSPGDPTDTSWRAIDWTPPAFMCKYRNIAISKLLQKKFDFQAYAVDPIARSEEDAKFNEMKVKLIMRDAAKQAGSPLADSPVLAQQPGDPEDLEQLAMQKEYGYKHVMAMEAEEAINLIFQQNNIDEIRKQTVTSLYDYGIGADTQWIDENGMVKQRSINMEYFGCSYFEKPDGSDMVHWFEVVPTFVGDLAPYYTKAQLDDICQKCVGRNGNPGTYMPVSGFFNQSWNRFKVLVMQIKFLSWNDTIYKEEIDGRSNTRFGKSDYRNIQFLSVNKDGDLEEGEKNDSVEEDYHESLTESGEHGQPNPKYIKSTRKVSYKASWVIDTDYMHDWGLRENQNRKLSSWWDTDLDIQLYAWDFYKMQFSGMTEKLMPFEDKACQIWFNLQNLANKLIPYLINIDFNAVEAVNFGKGGGKQKPSEIIDFIFSNFVVPYRSTDLLSRNPNYKPVSIEATGQLAAFAQLHEELEYTLIKMQQVAGLNDATDGSTVNAKNLNSTNEAMQESTNNALYLISDADKDIMKRTADAVIQKVQIAVKLGKVQGYAKALGGQTVKFFSINPDISLHELGIFIEESPTTAQREALWQDCNLKESQGLLTVGDKAYVMTVRNLKEAYMVLDYKIAKRKEQQQQFALQQTQAQAQANGQVAQMTEQMKQQTIGVQLQADLLKIQTEKEWEYRIEAMKKQTDLQGESVQAEARTIGHQIQAQAKIKATEISSNAQQTNKHIDAISHITGKQIDAETSKEVAKMKPKPTSA